jgi:predicted permease
MTDWQQDIRDRLAAAHRAADDDVILEWAQHAEAAAASARAEGSDATAADAHARRLIDEWCVNASGVPLADRSRRPNAVPDPPAVSRRWVGLGQDVRYALRRLARQPGFALVAVLLIAIGVGATTTLSSLTYDVLLKPLPFPTDGLIRLAEHREGETHSFPNIVTNGTYLSWSAAPATIDALAVWNTGTSTMTARGEAHRVRVASATASLFDVVPARPLAGRLFTASEEHPGANHVIVLGEAAAARVATTPAEAIGATIDLDGTPYRVVGVVDEARTFPAGDTSAWIPLNVPPVVSADGRGRSVSLTSGVARVKAGLTAAQAAAEGSARAQAAPDLGMVGTAVFGTRNKATVTAIPYLDSLTAGVRPALLVMVVAVLLLFGVAVANVAGMQLARMTSRRREVAIRSALGASPGRLLRQMLVENVMIGGAGGAAGWLLSVGLHGLLPRLLPASFPRLDGFQADWRVLAIALASATGASVVCGLVPAIVARRQNLVGALVEDSQAPAGGGARTRVGRLRVGILAAQVAVAALLLTGASLFGRSFLALLGADRGYDPHNLATVTLPMPDRFYTSQRRAQTIDAIVDRLATAPGVTAAAATNIMPLVRGDYMMSFPLPPAPGRSEPVAARAMGRLVSPAYFTAMGMHVVRGRGFTDADSRTSARALVVNETFARRYLSTDPVGTDVDVTYDDSDHRPVTVIGVIADVRQQGVSDAPQPELYFDYRQTAGGMTMDTPVIVARTSGDPSLLLPVIARYAQDAQPGLAVDSSMTMDDRILASLAQPRLYALLFSTFAAFSLLVAATGLFGVLSYSVSQRTREIGVRTALGARSRDIVALVVRQALTISVAGTAVGLIAAFLLVTLIGTLLYGVAARDVRTFVLVPAIILGIAGIACYGPARRAAAIDPLTALKINQ